MSKTILPDATDAADLDLYLSAVRESAEEALELDLDAYLLSEAPTWPADAPDTDVDELPPGTVDHDTIARAIKACPAPCPPPGWVERCRQIYGGGK